MLNISDSISSIGNGFIKLIEGIDFKIQPIIINILFKNKIGDKINDFELYLLYIILKNFNNCNPSGNILKKGFNELFIGIENNPFFNYNFNLKKGYLTLCNKLYIIAEDNNGFKILINIYDGTKFGEELKLKELNFDSIRLFRGIQLISGKNEEGENININLHNGQIFNLDYSLEKIIFSIIGY